MGTIRDPQTDVSTANYTISGDWEFDNILTYTSGLGFTNPTDIVDKQYVDSRIVGGTNEDNIYYVGKHGNDISNDGRNIGEAFLTGQKGVDTSDAQLPTISSQYVVRINDAGTYPVFSMTSKPYIHIDAEGAALETVTAGTPFEIGSNNSIKVNSITRNTTVGDIIEKTGTGDAYLTVDKIYGDSNTNAALVVTDGKLYANINSISVPAGKIALDVNSGSGSVLNLNSKEIEGNLEVAIGATATIITNDFIGDISVDTGAKINIIILGQFTGDITAGATGEINMIVGSRISSHNDSYAAAAKVNIQYLGRPNPRNLLIGGDYRVNPRQENPNGILSGVDGTYVADNTILVMDAGGAIKVESPLFGNQRELSLTTLVANKQFGIVIPIEYLDSQEALTESIVSMALKARWIGSPTRRLKIALLGWTGSLNAINRDPVATWQGGGLDPILNTNWHYLGTGSRDLDFSAPTVYNTFRYEDITVVIPSINNLAVFIWVDSLTIGLGETLSTSNVRCTASEFVGEFHPRSAAEEISLCQRYYIQSSPTVASTPATYFGAYTVFKGAGGNVSSFIGMNIVFPTTMAKIPILTPYSPATGTINFVRNESSSLDVAALGSRISQYAGSIELAATYSSDSIFSVQWTADARL